MIAGQVLQLIDACLQCQNLYILKFHLLGPNAHQQLLSPTCYTDELLSCLMLVSHTFSVFTSFSPFSFLILLRLPASKPAAQALP